VPQAGLWYTVTVMICPYVEKARMSHVRVYVQTRSG
jgi:hypothetical protein